MPNRELALLLQLIHPEFTKFTKIGCENIDEINFITLIKKHTLGPLVLFQVERNDINLPQKVMEYLKTARHQWNIQYIKFMQVFEEATEIIRKTSVRMLCLKGVSFAHKYYPDPTLRPFSDLDFIVKKENLYLVCKALVDSGKFEHLGKGEKELPLHYHLYLRHKVSGKICEMHWAISEGGIRGKANLQFILECQEELIEGEKVFVLKPEHNLLYMASHFVSHGFGPKLLWIADMLWALKFYQLSWASLKAESNKLDVTHSYEAISALLKWVDSFKFDSEQKWVTTYYLPGVIKSFTETVPEKIFRVRFLSCDTLVDKFRLLWFYFRYFSLGRR